MFNAVMYFLLGICAIFLIFIVVLAVCGVFDPFTPADAHALLRDKFKDD